MCGIAGFVSTAGAWRHDAARQAVEAMTATLEHRGPDDGGIWLDAEAGAALGHRRLSIIDLTPEGHQPMASACARSVFPRRLAAPVQISSPCALLAKSWRCLRWFAVLLWPTVACADDRR